MHKNKRIKEILEGNISFVIMKLSVPTMVAFLFHMGYNFVDRYFVSLLGDKPLGALGMAFIVQSIIIAIGTGVGIGIGSMVARLIGAGEYQKANNAATHSLIIVVIISLLFTVLMFFSVEYIFSMLGPSEEMLGYILDYSIIIILGSFFTFFSMVSNGILRGEGNTVTPMIIMIIGNIINFILDPVLIFGFGPIPAFGIKGAAYATLFGRIVAVILITISLLGKKNIIKLNIKNFKFDISYWKGIFDVGAPTMLTRLSNTGGMYLIFKIIDFLNYTDIVRTSYTIGFTFQQVAFLPIIGISNSIITITGQNFGAKNYSRLRPIIIQGVVLSAAFVILFSLIYINFADSLVRIFNKEANEAIIEISRSLLTILSFGFPFVAAQFNFVSAFQGIRCGIKALYLNFCQLFLYTPLFALVLPSWFGLNGIWLSIILSYAMGSIFGYIWISSELKKLPGKSAV
jgi:putative MATE family efflux protein